MPSFRSRALRALTGIILALPLAVTAANGIPHGGSFDASDNLITETQVLHRHGKAGRHTLRHTYDALGNRTSTTLPDGRTLNNLHYGSGHLHQVNLDGRVICDFERDALHRETLRTQGGLALRTQYDPLSRILARTGQPLIQHAPVSEGLDKRYQYDANGELTWRGDSVLGELTLGHDPTGRILSARTVKAGKIPATHEQHAYDEAANLLDPWMGGKTRGLVQHNRLLVFEDKRYQYDEYGRLIEKRTGRHTVLRLKWNKEHQLVESTIEKNGVRQHSRYEYDALGRRVLRRDAFTETRFIWDGMRLLQEKRGRRNTTYVYQPGSYEPIARVDGTEALGTPPAASAKIYHFHNHINGAPEELTNEAGQAVWRARYRTWGSLALEVASEQLPNPSPSNEATRQPIRMQGQYADAETGLYYNTFRYYDPDIGRFVSEDPIGLWGGLNFYEFAPNADVWIDPWEWVTSRAARREAMRQAGIPTSQQPISQSKNASGREYRYEIPEKGGGTRQAAVQQQTMDVSHRNAPHWEAGKVKVDSGTGETRMNRHGRPKINNPKGKAYYEPKGKKCL